MRVPLIGGEGNGGVMLPALHIGRDAPLGVALILHLLATTGVTLSAACCSVAPVHHRQSEGAPRSGTASAVSIGSGSGFPDAERGRTRWAAARLARSLAACATVGHRADRPTDR